MPELSQEMYYGPNVQNLVESDDCKLNNRDYPAPVNGERKKPLLG